MRRARFRFEKKMPGAKAAFQSAINHLGEGDHSEPHAPRLKLPPWTDQRDATERKWIQAADADIKYRITVNGHGPFPASLTKSHQEGLWQLEAGRSANPEEPELRVPVAPGDEVHVCVTAHHIDKLQTVVCGHYTAPDKVAFMGAPGHLVACSETKDAVDAHMFLHILNVEGRGLCIVHAVVWAKIEVE